jgi:hypothetical protein
MNQRVEGQAGRVCLTAKNRPETIRADEIRQAPGFAVGDINGNDGKAPGTVGPVRKVVSDARRQFFVVA